MNGTLRDEDMTKAIYTPCECSLRKIHSLHYSSGTSNLRSLVNRDFQPFCFLYRNAILVIKDKFKLKTHVILSEKALNIFLKDNPKA